MNTGCAPKGVGLAHAPYEIANLRRHLWSSRALPRFPGPIPGKGSPVPADDGVWPHDLQAGVPTRPAARQQDPQPSVGALQAQARWRVLVEHGQLVTKGDNLSLQGSTGPKTGGEESEKSNQNRVHRGCNHHPTNDGNLCVFKSGGVFGTHSLKNRFIVWKQAGWRTMVPFLTGVTHPSSSCGRETLSNVAHVLPRMCIRSASSEDRLREIGLEENRPPRISI
jgi:hypothetical protein